MDALFPARACDPWAVHSAKSFVNSQAGAPEVNRIQQEILDILKQSDGISLDSLVQRLKIKRADLEREIAALRHMEMVRGGLSNGKLIIHLW